MNFAKMFLSKFSFSFKFLLTERNFRERDCTKIWKPQSEVFFKIRGGSTEQILIEVQCTESEYNLQAVIEVQCTESEYNIQAVIEVQCTESEQNLQAGQKRTIFWDRLFTYSLKQVSFLFLLFLFSIFVYILGGNIYLSIRLFNIQ